MFVANLLLLGFSLALQSEQIATVKADSPISWSVSKTKASISAARGIELSRQYLGRDDLQPASQEIVAITDRDELGDPVKDRVVYLTLFRSLRLEREHFGMQELMIDLYIAVDAKTGRFVLAFTPPKDEWTAPVQTSRSMDAIAVETGWTLAAPTDAMSSTIAQVLGAVFDQYGSKFVDAGQVVVRARWVEQKFPARRDGGKLVPLREPASAWLVHSMGTLLTWGSSPLPMDGSKPEEFYYTQCIALVADSTLVLCPCHYAP